MEKLIKEYELLKIAIDRRIGELYKELKRDDLRTKERQHVMRRIVLLEEESLELIDAIREMRR